MAAIEANEGYIVKNYYPREKCIALREQVLEINAHSDPSWHPCLDGVPDYHRINDEYPKSWVKARTHTYYFHHFNNTAIVDDFRDIFEIKNYLAGEPKTAHITNQPSDGLISRVLVVQYPRGGGYLAEHADPNSKFALIQTLIQMSDYGEDYKTGGLYIRPDEAAPPVMIDPLAEMGDLMVLSPGVAHGVSPVDAEQSIDWNSRDGRWIILPLILRSDYNMDVNTKPKQLSDQQ